jgi:prepilin-type N-terminal cleavage/methylation domain-containing protein
MNEPQTPCPTRGFTLVELLIATAVFSLFLGGLFSLYRMGSGMFQAGSWKLQKQKEAERFLALLKERLEQASHATVVNPTGNPQLVETFSQLGYVNGTTSRAQIGADTRRLLMFVVCKPSIGVAPGMLLFNGVRALPTPGNPGLMNLELVSSTNVNHPAFAGTPFNLFTSGAPDLTRFNVAGGPTPPTFRLGANNAVIDVTEVASVTILFGPGTGLASETLLSVFLEFRHPNSRHANTRVLHRTVARIEVPAVARALGAL